MIRKIVQIDEESCTGCGACAEACHEGAIAMVNGKARLIKDDYCDGFGDCLPECPADAITIIEREAADYDEAAVKARKQAAAVSAPAPHGCPGSAMHTFVPVAAAAPLSGGLTSESVPSQIATWPIQIKLLPTSAPYFNGCHLLIAADCTAFAYGNFHHDYMQGRVTIIGCPKLDAVDYSEKLSRILAENNILDITIARMVVPCCGGLENAVKRANVMSGRNLPIRTVTFSLDGRLLSEA